LLHRVDARQPPDALLIKLDRRVVAGRDGARGLGLGEPCRDQGGERGAVGIREGGSVHRTSEASRAPRRKAVAIHRAAC
jgi:hypothetical protein